MSPSLATPYPVTTSSGSQVIWDWDKREHVPYTKPAPKPASTPGTPVAAPSDGARAEPRDPAPPEPRGPAEPAGNRGPDSRSSPGPTLEQQRRGAARRRGAGGRSPVGTSLLTGPWESA